MVTAEFRALMNNICKSEAPKGPSPAYASAHVIKFLLILATEETMGRITLAKRLGIGEGSVRTIIKRLLTMSLISVDAIGGCHLTEKGRSVVSELQGIIVTTGEIDLREMGIAKPASAAHLRGVAITPSLTRLRDAAVRNGAEGMMVFEAIDDRIRLPSMSEDISKDYPAIDAFIKSRFKPRGKDLILIGFAEDAMAAELGTLSASLNLVCSLLYT
jgi:DNA-binding MarR family transcriptional regulator